MANIGYIQMVRHCNQNCGFCSNPETPFYYDLAQVKAIMDDFAARGYFGVVLTGGEPTLSPVLAEAIAYGHERKLHVRLITNGQRLADPAYLGTLCAAGLQHVHVSVHTHKPGLQDFLTGTPGSLDYAVRALENLGQTETSVDINTVINRYNCDHLHEAVAWFVSRFPFINHVVWNNLDPSIGRATAHSYFVARLARIEHSLWRAMHWLEANGRTFRVERVPLCYMADFAHCSTETRKIVKSEERIVHFLDNKGFVRQTDWGHLDAGCCEICTLRNICAGLFDRGGAYDPAELSPLFLDPRPIVARIVSDVGSDPAWRRAFLAGQASLPESRPRAAQGPAGSPMVEPQVDARRERRLARQTTDSGD